MSRQVALCLNSSLYGEIICMRETMNFSYKMTKKITKLYKKYICSDDCENTLEFSSMLGVSFNCCE